MSHEKKGGKRTENGPPGGPSPFGLSHAEISCQADLGISKAPRITSVGAKQQVVDAQMEQVPCPRFKPAHHVKRLLLPPAASVTPGCRFVRAFVGFLWD